MNFFILRTYSEQMDTQRGRGLKIPLGVIHESWDGQMLTMKVPLSEEI